MKKNIISVDIPSNVPNYITPDYVVKCMELSGMQKEWIPKVGDWYLCENTGQIKKIMKQSNYDTNPGRKHGGSSKTGYLKAGGSWSCDIYIPNPNILVDSIDDLIIQDELRNKARVSLGIFGMACAKRSGTGKFLSIRTETPGKISVYFKELL